jgi:hypothetical protein
LQQAGKIRQKVGPRAPGPGRPTKAEEFQQKMQTVEPQQQQQQQQLQPQQQIHQSPQHQQQIVFNKYDQILFISYYYD